MRFFNFNPLYFAIVILQMVGSMSAAAPAISNRAASAEEIGYLPGPSKTSSTNPPPISWLNEKGATAWNLQVSGDSTFTSTTFEVDAWPYLMYTHTESLPAGRYYWRYRYTDQSDTRSDWSRTREFDISTTATPFPRPAEEKLQSIIPPDHPRMFVRPETLSDLRNPSTTNPQALAKLIRDADNVLTGSIMEEPKPWSTGKWDAGEWGEYLRQASAATAHMDTLAFAWLITQQPEFGVRAKAHLMQYATWDPHGPSSMRINDEVGMPMLHSISRTYDWIHPLLSPAEQETVRKHMQGRGEETFSYMRKKPYEQFVHNSHFGRMFHFLGEAGLAFYGEIPEAEKWLNYSMTIFYGWYPYWGREDGGWAEGLAYWTSYNDRITWWLELLDRSLGIIGSVKPFYNNVADFPLYVCPPGNPVSGFGDFSERPTAPGSVAKVVAAYALFRQNAHWQWFAEEIGEGLGNGPFGYMRSLRKKPVPAQPEDLPLLKLFPETGYALFHSDLAHPENNVHVAMRSSPFGNVSHSHNDQNAIVMSAYGEPLLVNTGTRDFYGSPFCKEYYWETISHNSVLFDGKGQSRDKDTTCSFVAHGENENVAWVVGDATRAYPGLVDLYRRWIIFMPDEGAVLVDEIRTTASMATLLFHGREKFEIAPQLFSFGQFWLTKGKVKLSGYIVSHREEYAVTFSQTDQYPKPLGNGKKPLFDEWHLKANVPLYGKNYPTQYLVTWLEVGRTGDRPDSKLRYKTLLNDKLTVISKEKMGFRLNLDLKKLTVERTK